MPKHLKGEVRGSQNRIRILNGLKGFTRTLMQNWGSQRGWEQEVAQQDQEQSSEPKVKRLSLWVARFPGELTASQRPQHVCFQED